MIKEKMDNVRDEGIFIEEFVRERSVKRKNLKRGKKDKEIV